MDSTTNLPFPRNNESIRLTFGWTDYTLFGSLLGMSLLIGIYFGFFSKQDSRSEYLFGGKTMAYVPVAISILASLLSGITFLGLPTEVYFHGAMYFWSLGTSLLNCLVAAYVFLPIFYNLQITSIYEYLELRFSKTIRTLASFLYTISLLLYIPVVIYVPSLAFSQVTGYSVHTISPIFSLVCITYTTMGGVKAVVWTDTIQFLFTVGGLFTVLVIGVNSIGGFSKVWRISREGGRLDIFDMNPSPLARNTFWGLTVGTFFMTLSRFAIGQKFVQRFLAIEKKADMRKAVFLLAFGWVALQISCIGTGLIVYAKYHDCDPLASKLVERNDQTLPYYVMDVAGHIHGLPGVFLAGLVSSALSTMSASLNTLSGIIYEDFVSCWIEESSNNDAKAAKIMKVISAIIGGITIAMIFVIEHLGTVFEVSNSLSSAVDGPLLGIFVLGILVPWVGKKGALTGAGVSLVMMLWIIGGSQWYILKGQIRQTVLPTSIENCPYPMNETSSLIATTITTQSPVESADEPMVLYRISFFYFILMGMLTTIVVALITSYILKETDVSKVDPHHLVPIMRRFLPEKQYSEVPLKETISRNEKNEKMMK